MERIRKRRGEKKRERGRKGRKEEDREKNKNRVNEWKFVL